MVEIEGWISLHRKVLDNPIVCKDSDHLAVWVYLLLNATHSNYDTMFKGKRITLTPGQLLTGRKSISSQIKVDEYKVQRILKTFENEHQIAQQTTSQNRLISILNWDSYQQGAQQNAQQVHNDCTTSAQRVHTNNNGNKDNNVNNGNKKDIGHKALIDGYTENASLKESINDFIKMRKTIKKPLTDRALKLVFTDLDKLTSNADSKIEILNQSTLHCWQGVFPIKKETQSKYNAPPTKSDFTERKYDYNELEKQLLARDWGSND